MSSAEEQDWVQGSDEAVRQHLEGELARTQGAGNPAEILRYSDAGEMRAAFLSATKIYHPSRFARRPEDIRSLASEVYLVLKEAYERGGTEAAYVKLDEVKAGSSGPQKQIKKQTGSVRALPESAARKELLDRRRAKLQSKLTGKGNTTKRIAQIRVSTEPVQLVKASEDNEEESQFEGALTLMNAGEFPAAAAAFKQLAVGRPSEKRYRMHMHYTQGRVKQSTGHLQEARAEYKRALGLDASFAPAHKAMSTLPDENKKKKGSILSKLFGK